jgi:hypothetical protein
MQKKSRAGAGRRFGAVLSVPTFQEIVMDMNEIIAACERSGFGLADWLASLLFSDAGGVDASGAGGKVG